MRLRLNLRLPQMPKNLNLLMHQPQKQVKISESHKYSIAHTYSQYEAINDHVKQLSKLDLQCLGIASSLVNIEIAKEIYQEQK